MVAGALPGPMTTDPACGLPAIRVDASMRDQAQTLGYTVVDAGTVVATHLNHIITMYASELLGRQEVQQLLDHIGQDAPKLIEDLVPKLLPLSVVQKVLQNLLAERVHIRDMRTIIETLSEHAPHTQDINDLTSLVRIQLGRAIVQQLFPNSNEVTVMSLDNNLERILLQAMQGNQAGGPVIEPGLAETLSRETEQAAMQQEQLGMTPILLVPGVLRQSLSKFLRRLVPNLCVLAHEELPDTKTIRVTNLIGG
jgi:flagellar biosynthesis protein FlhA